MAAKIKKDIFIAALQAELKEATFLLTEKDLSIEGLRDELRVVTRQLAETNNQLNSANMTIRNQRLISEEVRSHMGVLENDNDELLDELIRLRGELSGTLNKLRISEEGLRVETGANSKLTLQLRLAEERGIGKAEGLRQALEMALDRADRR